MRCAADDQLRQGHRDAQPRRRVRINHHASPRYLHGVHASWSKLDDHTATVCAHQRTGGEGGVSWRRTYGRALFALIDSGPAEGRVLTDLESGSAVRRSRRLTSTTASLALTPARASCPGPRPPCVASGTACQRVRTRLDNDGRHEGRESRRARGRPVAHHRRPHGCDGTERRARWGPRVNNQPFVVPA